MPRTCLWSVVSEWHGSLQDEGYLAKILVSDGAKDIPVGTLVAIVVDDKDDVRRAISMASMPTRHSHATLYLAGVDLIALPPHGV